jgi:hypothetical protein
VVLVRARDRGLGLCGGLSTATIRWWPVEARGSRGAPGAGQRGEATAAAKVRVTRGEEEKRRWTAASTAERRPGGSSAPMTEKGSRGAEGV